MKKFIIRYSSKNFIYEEFIKASKVSEIIEQFIQNMPYGSRIIEIKEGEKGNLENFKIK